MIGCPGESSTGTPQGGVPGVDGAAPPPPNLPPPPANAPPAAEAAARSLDAAASVLERLVEERCLDPQAPWALIHGLIARGPQLQVAGEPALDRFVRDNLDPMTLRFPVARGGVKVEPHPGYFVKNALELGVSPERTLTGQVTLGDLMLAHARPFSPADQPLPFFNEAWLLEILTVAGERDPALAARAADLRAPALRTLAQNQAYLEPWLKDRGAPYDKPAEKGPDGALRPAAIHRYVCGGLHFFQAVQRLHGRELPPALAHQYQLLRLRLSLEPAYWDGKLAEVRARLEPGRARRHEMVMLAQSLKVLGHGLETWLRAEADGALSLAPAERADVEHALAKLALVVLELEDLGIFRALDEVRAREPQLYLDLVGDGAHALHAVRLWQRRRS